MPSIHRQPGRPFWFCAFTLFDPETHTSKRVFRSTKTRDKKQALEVCRAWHKAALLARRGKLSADAAREVITRGVSDVYAAANLESLESATVRKWCEKWLETKSIEAEESTHARYKRIVDRFLECIGAKANRDLSTLQANDIARFRDREAKALSRATANLSLKVLRVCFGEAVRRGLGAVNPAVRVPVLKSRDKSTRRAFTLSEIKRILKACGNDPEWRGLVEPRGHEATGKGRSQAREPSEISFHSLRHSAVTMLKAAGVSDFITREIVGHESAAVSRQYTHLTTDDKRAAMQRLPDVTSA